ncbi:MAG: CpaF family protein [Armatimonadetes bacterium]|nr:CpaF family protein [Armatimonadota bacterium]PIY43482.1 MAG: hypothetical protein COZ05_10940 [Armatimonadetes bacterium CG_4_10_14_3_um_filter_59_10]
MGFGPLEQFLDDNTATKITVNAPNDIWVERLGAIEKTDRRFRDADHLMTVLQKIAATIGGRIDSKVPLLDRKLPDDSRIRAKVPPIAANGPTITIDKFNNNPFDSLKRQQQERQRSQVAPYYALKEKVQDRLVQKMDPELLSRGQHSDRLRSQVEEMINTAIQEDNMAMSRAERSELVGDLLNEIAGLGPIEPLLNDPEVSEIMVNGPFQIYVEQHGKLILSDKRFRDNTHVMQIIERIVAPLGRRVDEKSPMVDARLADGSRVNAIIPPLAIKGPTITIRKFSKDPFTMTDLVNFGSLSNDCAQFLKAAVEGRLNIVVSGGTGSGKTTTLNVLSSFIPTDERIVTVEDAAEVQLRQEHVVTLEARPPNIEGAGAVTIRDLVRNCLRMRPDRIVVGECRGGEALDMLQAMNTGHDGSLTTGHANSPREMLSRLEVMVLMSGMDLPIRAIREQIAGAVDIIVQCDRMRDGTRKLTYVTEVVGMEGDVITMQDLFMFKQEGVDDRGKLKGTTIATGLRPKCLEKIIEHGVKLPPTIFKSG